jgi:hypothetical protein
MVDGHQPNDSGTLTIHSDELGPPVTARLTRAESDGWALDVDDSAALVLAGTSITPGPRRVRLEIRAPGRSRPIAVDVAIARIVPPRELLVRLVEPSAVATAYLRRLADAASAAPIRPAPRQRPRPPASEPVTGGTCVASAARSGRARA